MVSEAPLAVSPDASTEQNSLQEKWDSPNPGALMKGKRGLIMGVANRNSIAWGIARALSQLSLIHI